MKEPQKIALSAALKSAGIPAVFDNLSGDIEVGRSSGVDFFIELDDPESVIYDHVFDGCRLLHDDPASLWAEAGFASKQEAINACKQDKHRLMLLMHQGGILNAEPCEDWQDVTLTPWQAEFYLEDVVVRAEIVAALNDPDPQNPISLALAEKIKIIQEDFKNFMASGGAGQTYTYLADNELEQVAYELFSDTLKKALK